MPLNLDDARRIATEVVAATDSSLRVVGAATEGGSNYTEIMITVVNCHAEPCRISIGVERNLSESAFRQAIGDQVRRHIRERESPVR